MTLRSVKGVMPGGWADLSGLPLNAKYRQDSKILRSKQKHRLCVQKPRVDFCLLRDSNHPGTDLSTVGASMGVFVQ